MKASLAVGRRITAIKQSRSNTRNYSNERGECTKEPTWSIDAIVLDDGSELRFSVAETDGSDYLVTVQHARGK